VLRFDGELRRRALGELIACPQAVEQVAAQISAERLLDDLAVTSSSSGRTDLHRAEHVLVNG